MASEDNHNHFCIYCGNKINPNQRFCGECGKPVFHEKTVKAVPSKYTDKLNEIEKEYDEKQARATELVEKQFDPSHMAYKRFSTAITKSNDLFENQMVVARKMNELVSSDNPVIEKELVSKIATLEKFIEKMEDLINELIIHLSNNKEDNDDVDTLFKDMDDLIGSVKNY